MGQTELLPLFPLSTVVLFPRVQCPLHLFEPRYRQLAAHVLAGERRIGMVAVRPEGVPDMAGDPALFHVGCAGVITEDHELPDGRYNIVLLGTERFRILREVDRSPERGFRVAEVEHLPDPLPASDGEPVARLRPRALELTASLVARLGPERAAQFSEDAFRGVDHTAFVNALCNAFPFAPAEKQGLLEADSVVQRFERLISVLQFHLAETNSAPTPGSGALH